MAFLVHLGMAVPFYRTERSLPFCNKLMGTAATGFLSNGRRRIMLVLFAKATTSIDLAHTENSYVKIVKMARQKFTKEISFAKKESDISLAKVTQGFCSIQDWQPSRTVDLANFPYVRA